MNTSFTFLMVKQNLQRCNMVKNKQEEEEFESDEELSDIESEELFEEYEPISKVYHQIYSFSNPAQLLYRFVKGLSIDL